MESRNAIHRRFVQTVGFLSADKSGLGERETISRPKSTSEGVVPSVLSTFELHGETKMASLCADTHIAAFTSAGVASGVFMPPNLDSSSLDRDRSRQLYLDLMKRCLINLIYQDQGYVHRRIAPYNSRFRMEGRDWPVDAHSMSGWKRLENVQFCIEDALRSGVPGDLFEAGVWRGGVTIFMRAVLKAYGITNRRVWAADSFEGLPKPDIDRYPEDAGDQHHTAEQLIVSLEQVMSHFERYDLLDAQVEFLKGWFKDTLPAAPVSELAVLRLDGDMYGSTMEGLLNLYPKLSPGGYVIVDDYGASPGCRKATEDFRKSHGVTEAMESVDWTCVCWKKD
jgi:hypothetical protein